MGVISSRIRRHRRTRLAAEMAVTWTPRRLFPLGQEQGGVYYPDDPNSLLRRRNILTYSEDFSNAAWYKYNAASGSGKVLTLVADNSYVQSVPTGAALLLRPGLTVTLRGVITSSHTQTIRTGIGDAVDGNPLVQVAHALVAGVPKECVQTLLLNSNFGTSVCAQILGVVGSSVPGSTLTVDELQLEVGLSPTTYQAVPTTWEAAYMAAVGHLVTQFTDSAGTTPVTKVTDPVGLTLDRRFGLYRGPQLMGAAFGNNGWTPSGTGGTKAVSGSTGSLFATVNPTANCMHEMIVVVSAISGTITPQLGNVTSTNITTPGTHYRYITPTAGTVCYLDAPAATTATVASVSVRELPGNHRIQATSGSRKTLSARVNLLTKTEQFDDAAWSKLTAGTGSAAVVTANAGTDPLGGSTADRVVFARGAGATTGDYSLLSAGVTGIVSGASHLGSVWMKSNTGSAQTVSFYLASFSSAVVNQVIGTTWTRVPVSLTSGTTSMNFVFGTRGGAGYTSDQDLDILVWGADLRTADDAAKAIPAYQRVNTASDYDTDGFPFFWLFDGTDDSDATASTVDGSASDKVTVIVGVTKNSDAAGALIVEHTASALANNGGLYVIGPAGTAQADYGVGSRGTSTAAASTSLVFASPNSSVVTMNGDIGADILTCRVNGTQRATSATDQGTGNYANATTYWGRRGGASAPFNGREYATILRFGPMSDSERNQAERWVAQRMGITL